MLRGNRCGKLAMTIISVVFSVLMNIWDKEWWRRIRLSARRHLRIAVVASEGAITAISAGIGYEAAEVASGIMWDPHPGMTGSHALYYGWPFAVKILFHSVNGVPPYFHSSVKDFPQNYARNAGFYGVLAFAILNAVACSCVLLYRWNENRNVGKIARPVICHPVDFHCAHEIGQK